MSKKYLYYFSEGSQAFGGDKTAMRNILGGKGSGLAEMCWETSPSVREVLTKCAENVQNPAFFVSKCDYEFLKKDNKSIDFSFHSLYYNSVRLCVHTEAAYQMENVTLALRALEVLLGKELTPETMQKGVAKAVWEGRMEEVLPGIFADGAHNPDGIRAFLESVAGDGAALMAAATLSNS